MYKKLRILILIIFSIVVAYVFWRWWGVGDHDGIVWLVKDDKGDKVETSGNLKSFTGGVDSSTWDTWTLLSWRELYWNGVTGLLETQSTTFSKDVDTTLRSNPTMWSYVMLHDFKTNMKINQWWGDVDVNHGISYEFKVIDPNIWLQINMGKDSTSEVQFCLDDSHCTTLAPEMNGDAVLVLLHRYLRPWMNLFLIKVSLEWGEQIFLHTVRIGYLSKDITYGWARVVTWTDASYGDVYDKCYENRYEWDLAQVDACVRKIKDTLRVTKAEACAQPDGSVLNRYLDIVWAWWYGEAFGWVKQNNTLYYSVHAWKTENEASCESPTFEVYLFSYDCAAQEWKKLYQFPKVGIEAWNCGVTIAWALDDKLIYRKQTYEWPYNGLYEWYEMLDTVTKQVIWLSFFSSLEQAKSLGLSPQFSDTDRLYMREDAKKIVTHYMWKDIVTESACVWDAWGFRLTNITSSGMILDCVFDRIVGPNGISYTLKKSYDLLRTPWWRALKR